METLSALRAMAAPAALPVGVYSITTPPRNTVTGGGKQNYYGGEYEPRYY